VDGLPRLVGHLGQDPLRLGPYEAQLLDGADERDHDFGPGAAAVAHLLGDGFRYRPYLHGPQARTIPGLLIYRYDSPLFFANAEDFRRRALAAVDEHHGAVKWFVLNTEANVEVDITALDAVEALRLELHRRGIVFALARVKHELREDMDAYGLTASVGADRIYPTLPTAVAACQAWRLGQQGPWPGIS
jgi:MFS superfamily sulfate permease-like transporter